MNLTKAQPGKEEEVVKELQWFSEQMKKQPGTRGVTIFRSMSDPTEFLMYEEFVDDAAYKAHSGSAHVKASGNRMGPLLQWVKALTASGEDWRLVLGTTEK